MTGPEHYREAEQMLAAARIAMTKDQVGNVEVAAQFTAEAQVHATLALAAATALPHGGPGTASQQAWVRTVHGIEADYDVTESIA